MKQAKILIILNVLKNTCSKEFWLQRKKCEVKDNIRDWVCQMKKQQLKTSKTVFTTTIFTDSQASVTIVYKHIHLS